MVLILPGRREIRSMSVSHLLKSVAADAEGPEVALRVVGTREPPARMVIQVAIVGSASVQIQGRIARDAPWQSLGPAHRDCALLHVEPVQFLRAVATGVAANTTVSVWAVWAW
jgi:hypothetical protein